MTSTEATGSDYPANTKLLRYSANPAYLQTHNIDRRIQRIQDLESSKVSLLQKVLCVVSVVGILFAGLSKFCSYVDRELAVRDLKNYVFSRKIHDLDTANKVVCYLREYRILPPEESSLTTTFKRFDLLEEHLPEILKQMPETKRETLLFLQNCFINNEEITFDSVREKLKSYFQTQSHLSSFSADYQRECLQEAIANLKVPKANKESVLCHLAKQPSLSVQNLLSYSEETLREEVQKSLHIYHEGLLFLSVEKATVLRRHPTLRAISHLDKGMQGLVIESITRTIRRDLQ